MNVIRLTVRRQHPQAHIHHQAKAVNIGTTLKCHNNQKTPKYQSCSQDVHFPCFSSHYVVSVSDQVSAKVDLITFLITTELQSLEKVLQSDVSISLGC